MWEVELYDLSSFVSIMVAILIFGEWLKDNNAIISWFKNIKNKRKCIFMQFEISLLLKAIDYTKDFVNISDDETKTIMHSRKPLLFSGTDVWIKKDGDKDFDATMASFNGAQICEVVGLYILY